MGAVFESLRIENSRIPVKSIRGLESGNESAVDKIDLNWNTEESVQTTEEPLGAPLAILVEMVLVAAAAVVVWRGGLEAVARPHW
jgi:hypothetical protein